MEAPPHEEAATADLNTDIVVAALDRSREPSSLGPGGDAGPEDGPVATFEGLTREEDDELRRLNWMSQIGALAVRKIERMIELRLRDRRKEIRPPREFTDAVVEAQPADELRAVRQELDRIVHARLLRSLSEDEARWYEELLAAERSLLASKLTVLQQTNQGLDPP